MNRSTLDASIALNRGCVCTRDGYLINSSLVRSFTSFPDAPGGVKIRTVNISNHDSRSNGTLLFDRRGINLEHIKKFDLPQNPNPSSTDKDRKLRKRFQNHISEGRDVNVELNALKEYQREYLESLVRESIEEHIDEDARQRVEERIEEEQAKIRKAIHIDDDVLGGTA